jgi:outer membrane biosynthesis protein TonB
VILALLIIFITFRVKLPDTSEEGLLVNFGFDETGEGLYEPAPQPVSPPVPPPSASDEGSDDAILTQDFEEAPEVVKKEPDPEEIRRQAEARAAQIRREQELEAERKRIEQEELERQKELEEQRLKDRIKARVSGALTNTGTTGQSEGIAEGTGNQGDPSGNPGVPNYTGGGQGTGVSFELGGRKAQSLVKPPYNIQKDGIVVVDITVDRSGRVTAATPGAKGSTTLEESLLKLAKEAALQTKFEPMSDGPIIQYGKITYDFRLSGR